MIRGIKAFLTVLSVMVILDLIWLGVIAEPIYSEALGALRAKNTVVSAAILFYVQYILVIVFFAVLPALTLKQAALRGAGIGWVGYATYELTNWAVIEGWPLILVPVDIIWGVFLTTSVAVAGRAVAGGPAAKLDASTQ
jgi:uncharacterized membrane protein